MTWHTKLYARFVKLKLYRWFVDRTLIGSDTVIALAIFIHVYEGIIFLCVTPTDGWSIGMSTLLNTFRYPSVAAVALFAISFAAAWGQWRFGLQRKTRWICLLPQLALLIMTMSAAIYASAHETYANGVRESWAFISTDQIHRILMPIAYASAIWARIRRT